MSAEKTLYSVTYRNVPLGQAKAMYRVAVNLADEERIHGSAGMVWSGLIPGDHRGVSPSDIPDRTITIEPMPTHEQATRERDYRDALDRIRERLAALDPPDGEDYDPFAEEGKASPQEIALDRQIGEAWKIANDALNRRDS